MARAIGEERDFFKGRPGTNHRDADTPVEAIGMHTPQMTDETEKKDAGLPDMNRRDSHKAGVLRLRSG